MAILKVITALKINTCKLIYMLSIAVLITACNGSDSVSDKQHTTSTKRDSTLQTAAVSSANIDLKDGRAQAVYEHYSLMQKALVAGDSLEAKVAALAIEVGSKDWAEGHVLKSKAQVLANTSTLERQRTLFADFSLEMITLIKKSQLQSGDLFVQYCPMALDNKGAYWLSSDKEIRNPYYGASMLNCGENKEHLNGQ